MDIRQLKDRLQAGEDSGHQFKETFTSIDHLAVEVSAFANSQGGTIIVGVNDHGEVTGLDGEDIRKLNQWISNATAQKIEPPIFVSTQTMLLEPCPERSRRKRAVLIIEVPRGSHKPYCVNKSEFWVKSGADKRRATREELFRLMQASSRLFADEMLTDAPVEELDVLWLARYYQATFGEALSDTFASLSTGVEIADEGLRLTIEWIGEHPGHYRPDTYAI